MYFALSYNTFVSFRFNAQLLFLVKLLLYIAYFMFRMNRYKIVSVIF